MHDLRRVLSFPGLLNVRELGGYPTLDGGITRWRSLVRADDLCQLLPEGVNALANYGIRTIIDLRWLDEVNTHPNGVAWSDHGIKHWHLSLLAAAPEDWRRLSEGSTKEDWKCIMLRCVQAELRTVLEVIARSAPEPLLFHCVSGKDRTGLIAALLLALAEVVPESIAYDYAASTRMLEGPYLKRYAGADPNAILEHVRCPEEGVHRMLAYLAEQGGVRAYLSSLGLTGDDISELRARLRD